MPSVSVLPFYHLLLGDYVDNMRDMSERLVRELEELEEARAGGPKGGTDDRGSRSGNVKWPSEAKFELRDQATTQGAGGDRGESNDDEEDPK